MTRQGGWSPTGFGEQLKRLREARGLTQQELGWRSGCHPMTVAKLERGVQEPAWPLVLALAKALGVSCEAFQSGGEQSPAPQSAPKPSGQKATPNKGRGRK